MGNTGNGQKFNGLSFDISLGDFDVQVKKFSLTIKDNSAAAKKNGKPDGWLLGDVEADGELVVDRTGLKAFTESAKKVGSFQEMPTFDIHSYAKIGDDEVKVEAFGCKVSIGALLDLDKNSSDETEFKLPYKVTSPDFVKIDGVPYAKESKKK
jgi:hypothetical protein